MAPLIGLVMDTQVKTEKGIKQEKLDGAWAVDVMTGKESRGKDVGRLPGSDKSSRTEDTCMIWAVFHDLTCKVHQNSISGFCQVNEAI